MKKSEILLILILTVVGFFGFSYFKGYILEVRAENLAAIEFARLENIRVDSFKALNLRAKSAIVFDPVENKSIYARHEYSMLPLASITKVMTAITALENMPISTIITISRNALGEEGDNGLYLGESWALKDLIEIMLISSSNDAAKAISETYDGDKKGSFISAMNTTSEKIGLERTNFLNETGLDINISTAGSLSSAKDVALFMNYFHSKYPEISGASSKPSISITSEDMLTHYFKNTDILLTSVPYIKSSKTGFTDLAGGNLAVIFEAEPGHDVIAVVLGSTYDERFEDIKKLMLTTREYYKKIDDVK